MKARRRNDAPPIPSVAPPFPGCAFTEIDGCIYSICPIQPSQLAAKGREYGNCLAKQDRRKDYVAEISASCAYVYEAELKQPNAATPHRALFTVRRRALDRNWEITEAGAQRNRPPNRRLSKVSALWLSTVQAGQNYEDPTVRLACRLSDTHDRSPDPADQDHSSSGITAPQQLSLSIEIPSGPPTDIRLMHALIYDLEAHYGCGVAPDPRFNPTSVALLQEFLSRRTRLLCVSESREVWWNLILERCGIPLADWWAAQATRDHFAKLAKEVTEFARRKIWVRLMEPPLSVVRLLEDAAHYRETHSIDVVICDSQLLRDSGFYQAKMSLARIGVFLCPLCPVEESGICAPRTIITHPNNPCSPTSETPSNLRQT